MAELPERPKLAPGVRLHFDTTRQAWVLLGPERVIETEGPASEILRRCDGSRTVGKSSMSSPCCTLRIVPRSPVT